MDFAIDFVSRAGSISVASYKMAPNELTKLVKKAYSKPRLKIWLLLMQELDILIKCRRHALNQFAVHFSRIESLVDPIRVSDKFPD